MKRTRAGSRAGYTLVELLFVTIIVSLLLSLSYPAVGAWLASSRVDNAARIVAGDLRLAQSLASRQGTPIRFVFDAGSLEYELIDRATAEILHRRALGAGTEFPIGSGSSSVSGVDLFPNRVASGPLMVTLLAGGHSARVEMTRAGFIRVVEQ